MPTDSIPSLSNKEQKGEEIEAAKKNKKQPIEGGVVFGRRITSLLQLLLLLPKITIKKKEPPELPTKTGSGEVGTIMCHYDGGFRSRRGGRWIFYFGVLRILAWLGMEQPHKRGDQGTVAIAHDEV
jgi:hypothetical protein